MERIVLFTSTTPDIKVTIEAYFDAERNLVVEGYDIGKQVEEYWGDSDYEYATTIPKEEVTKLYVLFNLREDVGTTNLLSVLQAKFNTNSCYSDFREFLEKNGILFKSFSWT
jgi:hypothetical protein